MRNDVGEVFGGDITRKRKLYEKQAELKRDKMVEQWKCPRGIPAVAEDEE